MLYTDSQYVRSGITEWIQGWKRNGWRTADKKPVKNADLWQRLDAAVGAACRCSGTGCGAMPGMTSTSAPTNWRSEAIAEMLAGRGDPHRYS